MHDLPCDIFMGTRSRIALEMEDGRYESVYCHWDGYLDYNGAILYHYYNTREKVKSLIALGSISSLGKTTDYRSSGVRKIDGTQDYHRWRGEDISILYSPDIQDLINLFINSWEEYLYIMNRKGEWYCIALCYDDKHKDYLRVYKLEDCEEVINSTI